MFLCWHRARGYSVERFHMDSDSLFLSNLDEDADILFTTRSLQDLSHHQTVPPIPPKPSMAKARSASASALNCRGICHGYNNFTFPEDRPSGGENEDPSIPPPIPRRSKSREHYYHTLEYTDNPDSGLALSSYSQSNNSSSSQDSPRNPEKEPHKIQQLFDDPRYVALKVEGAKDLEDGDLSGRKEIWRSTPSLAATRVIGSGGRDRRSLRLTHVVGTEIYY